MSYLVIICIYTYTLLCILYIIIISLLLLYTCIIIITSFLPLVQTIALANKIQQN